MEAHLSPVHLFVARATEHRNSRPRADKAVFAQRRGESITRCCAMHLYLACPHLLCLLARPNSAHSLRCPPAPRVHAFLEHWCLINYQVDPTTRPIALPTTSATEAWPALARAPSVLLDAPPGMRPAPAVSLAQSLIMLTPFPPRPQPTPAEGEAAEGKRVGDEKAEGATTSLPTKPALGPRQGEVYFGRLLARVCWEEAASHQGGQGMAKLARK